MVSDPLQELGSSVLSRAWFPSSFGFLVDIDMGPNYLDIFKIKPNFGRGEVEQGSPPAEPMKRSAKYVQMEEKALQKMMIQASKGDLYDEMFKSNDQMGRKSHSERKGVDVEGCIS